MRVPLPPNLFFSLINHGPTTLISAANGQNISFMSAAWIMPIDMDPPQLVISVSDSYTRELMLESGEFVVNIPTVEMIQIVYTAGITTGRSIDKFSSLGLATRKASIVSAPIIERCVGWIECVVLPSIWMLEKFELVVADVVAAWVEDSVYHNGCFDFSSSESGTLHHISKGKFFIANKTIEAEAHHAYSQAIV